MLDHAANLTIVAPLLLITGLAMAARARDNRNLRRARAARAARRRRALMLDAMGYRHRVVPALLAATPTDLDRAAARRAV